MRFTADSAAGNLIQSFANGEIRLASRTLNAPAIITHDIIIDDWQPPALTELSRADFQLAMDLKPDIILFGTGSTQRFPDIHVLTDIMRAGVAIEVMSTDAACRTFNVLIGENRAVAAALLVE